MVSDTVYDLCLPVLEDKTLEEEDKTERLEELLGKETSLAGPLLEDAIDAARWNTTGCVTYKHGRDSSTAAWSGNRAAWVRKVQVVDRLTIYLTASFTSSRVC